MPDGSAYPIDVKRKLRRGNTLTRRIDRAQDYIAEASAERKALVKMLRDAGVQYADIADAFGVTESAVRHGVRPAK